MTDVVTEARARGKALQEQALTDALAMTRAAPRCPDHPAGVVTVLQEGDLVTLCSVRECNRELDRRPHQVPDRESPPGY